MRFHQTTPTQYDIWPPYMYIYTVSFAQIGSLELNEIHELSPRTFIAGLPYSNPFSAIINWETFDLNPLKRSRTSAASSRTAPQTKLVRSTKCSNAAMLRTSWKVFLRHRMHSHFIPIDQLHNIMTRLGYAFCGRVKYYYTLTCLRRPQWRSLVNSQRHNASRYRFMASVASAVTIMLCICMRILMVFLA